MPKQPSKPKTWKDALFSRSSRVKVSRDLSIALRQDPECTYCGEEMDRFVAKKRPTRDHALPRSRGHTLAKGNKIICCEECNQLKRNRSLLEWLRDLRRSKAPKDVIRATRINHLIEDLQLRGIRIDDSETLDGSVKICV